MINVRVEATRLGRYAFGLLAFVCIRGDACGVEPSVTRACSGGTLELGIQPGHCAPLPYACDNGQVDGRFLPVADYDVSVVDELDAQLELRPAAGLASICVRPDARQGEVIEFVMEYAVRADGSDGGSRVQVTVLPAWSVSLEPLSPISSDGVVLPATPVELCPRIVGAELLAASPKVTVRAVRYPTDKCGSTTDELGPVSISALPSADCGTLSAFSVDGTDFGCYHVLVTAQPMTQNGQSIGVAQVDVFEFKRTDGPVATITYDSDELKYPNQNVMISSHGSGTGDPRQSITMYKWTVAFQPPASSAWSVMLRSGRENVVIPQVESGRYKLQLIVTDSGGRTSSDEIEVDARN